MPKTNQIFRQKPPPNFCPKVVAFKRGGGHTYGKCIADVSLNCMHTHQTLEPMKAVPSVLRHLGKFTGGFPQIVYIDYIPCRTLQPMKVAPSVARYVCVFLELCINLAEQQ